MLRSFAAGMMSDNPSLALDWTIWQLVDSAFPTGGFAHSWGLEAAWQHQELTDRAALQRFVEATALQTASGALPLVAAAYREPARIEEWDELNDAFLTNAVANRASRQQGRTLVGSASRIWPGGPLDRLATAARSRACHVAPMTGVVFKALGIPLVPTLGLVLFVAVRGVTSAAVRLGAIGSYDAQQLQHACAPVVDRLVRRTLDGDIASLAQTAPIIDVLQGTHDRLYSRLFQS
jgi:urease accessory protein